MKVKPIPKPRKPIKDRAFFEWLATHRCIYCGNPSGPPHHIRWGQGDGRGSASRKPDDYRCIAACLRCHDALHGKDKNRLEWMTKKIGREEIHENRIKNLMRWQDKQGEDMEQLLDDMLDWLINRIYERKTK